MYFAPERRKDLGPVVGIEELGLELRGKVLVWKIRAINLLVKYPSPFLESSALVLSLPLVIAFQYHSA